MQHEHAKLVVGVLKESAHLTRTITGSLKEFSPSLVILGSGAKNSRLRQVPDDVALVVIDDAEGKRTRWNIPAKGREGSASFVFINARDDARCAYLLQHGADEAIVAGSASESVRLRIAARRALLKRAPAEATIGDIHIDQSQRHVVCAGREVRLTAREWEVLLCLVSHYPHAASIEDVAECVWGEADVDKAYSRVQVYVHYLRNKLAGSETMCFENVRGIGYRIVNKAQVSEGQRDQASA